MRIVQERKQPQEIKSYLILNESIFVPRLESRTNIDEYSYKLFNNAIQFWGYFRNDLAGFMACYFNHPQKVYGYITTISIIKKYQGQGFGQKLVKKAIAYAEKKGFATIKLEVNKKNDLAITLYKKLGFIIFKTDNKSHYMELNLKHKRIKY